ncbi:GNAT family N-acetyltransferase [Antribacter gilvus]|uniref:GNAT family N-acetyltransferase n=1 Tax=Antribacter gilvus TaxID=2304675 RepID=UPI0013DFD6C9|nr:GNAT family N-acetyltransferase [Antribacter gilvus]
MSSVWKEQSWQVGAARPGEAAGAPPESGIVHVPPEGVVPFRDLFAKVFDRVADDFIPSLRRRADLLSLSAPAPPDDEAVTSGAACPYLVGMFEQHNLIALADGEPVGFLTFRDRCVFGEVVDLPHLRTVDHPCVYVNTVAVVEHYRRRGQATGLYQRLFELQDERQLARTVVLRTWVGNDAHLAVLDQLGFEELGRRHDGIVGRQGSVYLARTAGGGSSGPTVGEVPSLGGVPSGGPPVSARPAR